MSLNSPDMIIMFAGMIAVLSVLRSLDKKYIVARNIQLFIILLFSYYSIYTYNVVCCVSIFAVTVWTYTFGRMISAYKNNTLWCRLLLWGGNVGLILFLCWFKYADFFLEDNSSLRLIMPVGISFYAFTAISYLVDVKRGVCGAERSFLAFALYLSFFPKIIAGPIVRGKEFLSQVKEYKGIAISGLENGVQIFVMGMFKKMVLADHLGVFVDDVFRMPEVFNTGSVILGAVSYSLQIYLDFSGYSDMAVGMSRMLGFELTANFNLPYIAENVSDFWSRWHISLSTWLRDYIYIPLGGSRKGNIRTYVNLMATMLVSGLWHGVGWTFVVWGGMHGVLSCLHSFCKNRGCTWEGNTNYIGDSGFNPRESARLDSYKVSRIYRALCATVTFMIVTLLWVIFRADNIFVSMRVFKAMFTIHSGISQPYSWSFFAILIVAVATFVAWKKSSSETNQEKLQINGFYPIMDLSRFWNLVLFFVICGLVVIMGYFGNTAFIYGKF